MNIFLSAAFNNIAANPFQNGQPCVVHSFICWPGLMCVCICFDINKHANTQRSEMNKNLDALQQELKQEKKNHQYQHQQ